jgi:hypothetical protein
MGAVEEIHERERRAALAVAVLVVRYLREHHRGRDHDWEEVRGPDPTEQDWGKIRSPLVVRFRDYSVEMTLELRISP